jgi:pimeloyl-ACP methyl ester carboxylesterase
MPIFQINALNLHLLEAGRGQPVLFLHGLGACGEDWLLQTPVFAQHFRMLAPDFRGHGHSDDSRGRITVARLAQDMAALLAALDIPSTHIVGWSLGGLVAQQLALDFPAVVQRLVLVNTFAHLWPTNLRETFVLGRRVVTSLLLPIETTARVVAFDLFPKPDQSFLRERVMSRVGGNNQHEYRKYIRAVRSFDLRRQLSRIHAPTLVITGENDNVVPRGSQLQLVRSIPHAEWKLIQDSGHATPIDQPDEFNRVVMEFLQRDK